jgi:hypothetical protein
LLAAIIGVVMAVPYLYRRVDEQIRRRLEEKLAQHYTGLKVKVDSAHLVEGEGIEVRGLSLSDPGVEGPRAEILNVESVRLSCRYRVQDLIRGGEPDVTQVLVRHPTLHVTCRPDGSWSTSPLWPFPRFSPRPPEVKYDDGVVEIVDLTKSPSSALTLRNVNLTLTRPAGAPSAGRNPSLRQLRGTVASEYFHQMQIEGLIDPHGGPWSVAGSIEGLAISPEFREALPGVLSERLAKLGSLRGQATLGFRLGFDPAAAPAFRFDVSGRLTQGNVDDRRLPHPLTDLRGAFRVNNEGVAVDNLLALCGPSAVQITSFRRAGFDESCPQWLEAQFRDLELDHRLMDVLPEPLKQPWIDFLPSGRVHAELKLAYDGRTWQPEVSLQCLSVSFSYHKFPYRLERATGEISLKDNVFQANLVAYSGDEPVRITGRTFHPLEGAVGEFDVKGQRLPLDEKLFSAMPARLREVMASLNPRGFINDFSLHVGRDQPDQPWHRQLAAQLAQCSLRYKNFPYPLTEIAGRIEMEDDHWTFRQLCGLNGASHVTCNGRLDPLPEGSELLLDFTGSNVLLEDELRGALLHSNMQQVWNELRLRGIVDLAAQVHYRTGQERPSVVLRAELHPDSVSIEPVYFPYRLEKLRGVLTYQDGHVSLEHLKGEHGTTSFSAAATCDFLPDGSWRLRLERLAADRVRTDRDLVQSLPSRLRKALLELNPTGPWNITGELELARGPQPGDPLTSQWDVDLGLCQGSLDCGVRLENLNGGVHLVGRFDGRRFQSLGELDLDSVKFNNLQLSQVRGPLWIDDKEVLFGYGADRRRHELIGGVDPGAGTRLRPLTAQLFGGTLYGNAWADLGTSQRFELNATLSDADLGRLAQQWVPGRQNLTGTILASISLRGQGRSLNALGGHGSVQLRNADIYELPVMIALLKILSVRSPDRTAFSESQMSFVVQGPHLYFDPITFTGDAISLEGKGEMDFQTVLHLQFHARLGRNKLDLPLIKDLLGGASEQIMTIHIDGPLQDPVTKKVAFPGLRQLQTDNFDATGKPGFFGQMKQWLPGQSQAN